MAAQDKSIQNEDRHSVFVNGFGSGLAKDFDPYLNQLRVGISSALLLEGESTLKGKQLRDALVEIKLLQQGIYTEYSASLLVALEEFGVHESIFEAKSLDDVVLSSAIEVARPAPAQVWAAINSTPLVFPDSDTNKQLKAFIKDWTKKEVDKVNGIITTGFLNGETNQQIAKRISGKNGHLDKITRRNNQNIVRTSVNHVSSVARLKTMEENDDVVIGYVWVSTLDRRTSSTCRSLDGKEFKWSAKYRPQPPQHIGCRSTTAPLLDKRFDLDTGAETRPSIGSDGVKPVSAKTSYYEMLKKQSAAYQDAVLGKTRGQLFRNGGLSADEFAKLNVDQKFRPINLDEMKEKDPLSFSRAGL